MENVVIIPVLVLASICGVHTALGAGIGTMFISIGYVFTFGGLLVTLPDEKTFENFISSMIRIVSGHVTARFLR